MTTRVAVVTVVHGRRAHLVAQEEALRRGRRRPDHRVVVGMDEPAVRVAGAETIHVSAGADGALPLAAARNAGVRRALDLGADAVVLLDVDCLPGPGLVAAYASACAEQDAVHTGPVTYLSAEQRPYRLDDLASYDAPHPARPAPGPGRRVRADRWELLWSLSLGLSAAAWTRTGGFDEAYVGYGGEDTDFGQRARAAGLGLVWWGDARAYHQHHPTSTPPVQHVADVVRNGRVFRDRWGWWPMQGWLDAFEDLGRVARVGDDYAVVAGVAAPGAPARVTRS